jgi:nitroreductase
LKATDLGLATCWIGAFDENPIQRIIDVPEDFVIEAILPVGYEQVKEPLREKIDPKHLVRYNKWKTKYVAGGYPKGYDSV